VSYFVVFLVAAAAGLAVGFLTLRQGRIAPAKPEAWTGTYGDRGGDEHPAGDPTTREGRWRRRLPPDPNPHTRKIGAAGLTAVVLGAAGAIALFAYLVWTVLKGVFSVSQR
jgi:hypothetical protein